MRVRLVSRNGIYFFIACICLLWLNVYFVSENDINSTPRSSSTKKEVVHEKKPEPIIQSDFTSSKKDFSCTADGKVFKCLEDRNEVYFPFSYIKKRFDVSGKYGKDSSTFELSTSYAKVKVPEFVNYDNYGEFGHFASYSVETRERVRCIHGASGVPMSTQWDNIPYYYPIQIAQYGLQHYSRMLGANSTTRQVILGKEHRDWQGSASSLYESSARTYFVDEVTKKEYVNISSGAQLSNAGVYLYLDNDPVLHIVTFNWMPSNNASFTFLVKILGSDTLVLLNYVQEVDERCVWNDDVSIDSDQVSFSYSLGDVSNVWSSVTRDLLIDTARALTSQVANGKKSQNIIFHPEDLKLISIGFRGEAMLEQRVVQSSETHKQNFLRSADWGVNNQDELGGWPVSVERSIADRKLVLPAGWHSAMAQGHMISLLIRAYHLTENEKYLTSAVRGLDLFEKGPSDGGVRNSFLSVYPWFEEYPTSPGSFVLNGFMYSLIGLYDLSEVKIEVANWKGNNTIVVRDGISHAMELFSVGMESLKSLLPLFDTGSGSIYDLRHFSLKTAPNLARWDYHAVHIYLLKWLYVVTKDPVLNEVAERWIGYANGKRAKHN